MFRRPAAPRLDLQVKVLNAIETLDATAFVVESQTSHDDKVSFLRLQKLIRSRVNGYVYVEVGSHLGGTLTPHLADPRCRMVISIDPRPLDQPDVRGRSFAYEGNSTAQMVEGLKRMLPEDCFAKLRTFDLDAAEVCHAEIKARADLVMIDGEHTIVAVFSDVMSLLPVVSEDAVIAFHDANLVADAIRNLEQFFTYAGVKFATVFLPDYVCAIGLRGMADHITTELGPHGYDRDRFLVNAKHQVWGCVVAEALARGDVAPRQQLDASEEARATLQRELEEAHRAANNAVRAAGEEAKAREALRSQLRV
jgi:Methyltransferase domain